MGNIIEILRSQGCDMDGAMRRFMNDEEFYQSFLSKLVEDPAFDGLVSALDSGDIKTAFECAHTLKGVIGNMGITPMYETICAMVEPLRGGSAEGCAEKCQKLLVQRTELSELIAKEL